MKTRAFTLIELSIVLIVIGLIIGGVISAQELIKQASIRSLIKDIDNMQTSINTFKIKYDFLPGDFPKAGSIWTSPTCTNALMPTGCNGNGDWILSMGTSTKQEAHRFWQHLSLAGLIPGNYLGTPAVGDHPKSNYSSKTVVAARYIHPFLGAPSFNMLEFGAWDPGNAVAGNGAIIPLDAYSVDSKIDDGLANSGLILGVTGNDTPSDPAIRCSYGSNAPGVPDYDLTQPNPYCRVRVRIR